MMAKKKNKTNLQVNSCIQPAQQTFILQCLQTDVIKKDEAKKLLFIEYVV
jgi:hypothetical protein